jgi:anti-sigma-K factor RskA
MDIKSYIASGIIEMYVMGMCPEEEKKELELLRKRHPELHRAIEEFEIRFEGKMQGNSTLPDPQTDEKILHVIDALRPPEQLSATVIPIPRGKKVWLKPVAAAALLLLLVSSYFNYTLYQKTKRQANELKTAKAGLSEPGLPAADYAILKNPSITPVAMYGVGTHAICRCTLFWDKKTGKLYIMIHHLPLSSAQSDYQLWADVNGEMINVGIIKDEIRGRFIEMVNVPPNATAFTVTLEKAGGNTSPTLKETYLAGRI